MKLLKETGSRTALSLFFFAALLCSSCAAQISGRLDQAGAGNFSLTMSLKPRMANLIKSFQALDDEHNGLIIDSKLISATLGAAPGISSAFFRNTAPAAIDGTVGISKISDFLASGNAAGFIRFEQGAPNKAGRCTITITRKNGPELLAMISPDITEYLEALMAPIATGEELSKAQYLKEVASLYNAAISEEIRSSSIQVAIEFPGAIQSVKNGTFSGRRAEFSIPLLDLLVLEKPLSYEVLWR